MLVTIKKIAIDRSMEELTFLGIDWFQGRVECSDSSNKVEASIKASV